MEGHGLVVDEIPEENEWYNLYVDVDSPDCSIFLNEEPLVNYDLPPKTTEDFLNPSPDSAGSWLGEIESLLMTDDDNKVDYAPESNQDPMMDFFSDLLVDFPDAGDVAVAVDGSNNKESDVSDEAKRSRNGEEKDDGAEDNEDGDDSNDSISKKRRRQLRNRDAALRSRERKKMHVKDLEMKSIYLEEECRRLGRVLQCFVAENQALRLSLQKGDGASSTKQESAVLLMESLLLGSLLWLVGIMCLFTLPQLHPSGVETMEKTSREGVEQKGAGSKMSIISTPQSFLKSRRCKGSRMRMKRNAIKSEPLLACDVH